MTEPSKPFDRLYPFRHSEPLAVLASLSLVIAAFVFGHQELAPIYTDSIVSGFMFIISFVFSIAHDYYKRASLRYWLPIFDKFLEIGIYFFMVVGIIALLFVAYEFGKTQVQIFALVKTFFYSLIFGVFILGIVQRRKTETETETKDTEPQKLDTITILALPVILPVMFGFLFDSIMEVLYANIKFGPVISAFELKYVYPISPIILCVLLAIRTNNSRKKLISPTLKKRLLLSIILIGFIVGAIYSVLEMLVQYLDLFGIISHPAFTDLFKYFIQLGNSFIDSIRHTISSK